MDQLTTAISKNTRRKIFQGKTIFIISHENWGGMLLSKHHYAIELGKAGNNVYFINHPDKKKILRRGQIKLVNSGSRNVTVVESRLFHPYFLKFRFKRVYEFLVGLHINKIINTIGTYPDIVWSFDSSNTFPLRLFRKTKLRILMPVDGPFGHKYELESAEKADLIVSVTDNILSTYQNLPTPKLRIAHGVAEVFLSEVPDFRTNNKIRIGYSGSLLRPEVDFDSLRNIIDTHPDKLFEFWGECDPDTSNIHLSQDIGDASKKFIEHVKRSSNVKLHGAVSPDKLAGGLRMMDILLVCYKRDNRNTHKLLEYLGAGKVVVASKLSVYADRPDLVEMVHHENNHGYVELFNKIASDINRYNSKEQSEIRIQFARQYSYKSNIERVENFINEFNGHSE